MFRVSIRAKALSISLPELDEQFFPDLKFRSHVNDDGLSLHI